MRIALLILGATLLTASVGLVQLASAQTPTPTSGPTDTPSPTASPSPTPYPAGSSTITIRFVSNGQPVTVTGNLIQILADGVQCNIAILAAPVPLSIVTQDWPLTAGTPQPSECTKAPPTNLQFRFGTDAGGFIAQVTWAGQDATVDIEVPAPTPAPVELPDTGGRTSESASSRVYAVAALLAALGALAAAYAVQSGRWR